MEGARYSWLTYFTLQQKHHLRAMGTDVTEDVLGRCSNLSTPM